MAQWSLAGHSPASESRPLHSAESSRTRAASLSPMCLGHSRLLTDSYGLPGPCASLPQGGLSVLRQSTLHHTRLRHQALRWAFFSTVVKLPPGAPKVVPMP